MRRRPALALVLAVGAALFSILGPVEDDAVAQTASSSVASSASGFEVIPVRSGGWDFRWTAVPDATEYLLSRLTADFVGSPGRASEIRVRLPGTATSAHLPDGPWHTRTSFQERFTLTAFTPTGTVVQHRNNSCPEAFFLTARGSGENPPSDGYKSGLGGQGDHVYRRLKQWLGMSSSTLRVLPVLGSYPAVNADDWHLAIMHQSANKGTAEAKLLLADIRTHCPDKPVVMFGFSQGAWVVGDALEQAIDDSPGGNDTRNQVASAQLLADPRYGSGLPYVSYYPKDHGGVGSTLRARGPLGARPGVVTEWCFPSDIVCNSGGDDFHGDIYNTCYRDRVTHEAALDLVALPGDSFSAAGVPSVPSCNLDLYVDQVFDHQGTSWQLKANAGEQYLKALPLAGPVTKRCLQARGAGNVDARSLAAIWPEIVKMSPAHGIACIASTEAKNRAAVPVGGTTQIGYWIDGSLRRHVIPDQASARCYIERSGPRGALSDAVWRELAELSSGSTASACLGPQATKGKVLRLRSDQSSSHITYLVDNDGKRRHIPDVQVLSCLLSWQNRATVDNLTWTHVNSLPESSSKAGCTPPADLANKIIRGPTGNAFLVDSSLVMHSIRTTYTYHCLVDRGVEVVNVNQGQINGVRRGGAAKDCISPHRVSGEIIRRDDGVSWVVIDGKRRHIPTLSADVCARAVQGRTVALTGVNYDAAASIPEGEAFTCAIENKVLQALDQPQPYPAYRISGGKRYWIPDGWTFDYWKRRLPVVGSSSEAVIKELPSGGTDEPRLDPAAVPDRTIIRRRDGVSWIVDEHKVRHHIPFAQDDVCWRLLRGRPVHATGLTGSQADDLVEGDKWPCIIGNRVVKGSDGRSWFVGKDNFRHEIPDTETFAVLARKYEVVGPWDAAEIASLPKGPAHEKLFDPPANSIIRRSDGVSWVVDANHVRHHIPYAQDDVCWRFLRGAPVHAVGLTASQANALAEADKWPCIIGDRVVKGSDGRSWFVGTDNARHHIPDTETFGELDRAFDVVGPWPAAEIDTLPLGSEHRRLINPDSVRNGIMCRNGDGVCWVVDGNAVRHYIPSYGDHFCHQYRGHVPLRRWVDGDQASSLPEADHWGCSMNDTVVDSVHDYYMTGNTRRWIQDWMSMQCYSEGRSVYGANQADVDRLPETTAMPKCLPVYAIRNKIITTHGGYAYLITNDGIWHYITNNWNCIRDRHAIYAEGVGWDQVKAYGRFVEGSNAECWM